MRDYLLFFILLIYQSVCMGQAKLSRSEKKAGWELLFDGKTTKGWRGAYSNTFPQYGWMVKDGELRGEHSAGAEAGQAGDIITLQQYQNFELIFEWKLGKGGNSGVKYFIQERLPRPESGSLIGYEYQLIDDANYIYNHKTLPPDLKTASIYDVVAAQKPDVGMNVWHVSKIVVRNDHIEHWLDGVQVLAVQRNAEGFKQGVEDSKFKDYPDFASIPKGHILLQDHGHSVAFRNIKIRTQ